MAMMLLLFAIFDAAYAFAYYLLRYHFIEMLMLLLCFDAALRFAARDMII